MTALSALLAVVMTAAVAEALVAVGPRALLAEAGTTSRAEPAAPTAAYRLGTRPGPRPQLHYRGRITGRTVVDSSAAGNDGRTLISTGARVVAARTQAGEPFLHFTGRSCARAGGCPRAVVVPARDLRPGRGGSGPFSFGAWVRLTQPPGSAGMTVMQRGGDDPGAAQWSLHVDDGQVSCRWSDGEDTLVLPDDLGRTARLELGRWYALSCARSEGRVTLNVADPISNLPGPTWSEPDRELGAIDASGPVTIGATPTDGGTAKVVAQFRGDLDEVMFRAG